MGRLELTFAIFFFVFLPVNAAADTLDENLLDALYRKSGLETQVGHLPLTIQAGFDQAVASDGATPQMSRSVVAQIRNAVLDAYSPQRMKAIILDDYRQHLRQTDLHNVLRWLDSPIGRNFTHLEEAASAPEAQPKLLQYANRLQNSPPPPQRVDTVKLLIKTIQTTEAGVEILFATQVAIAEALMAALPQAQQPDREAIMAQIELSRPQVQAAIGAQNLVSSLYTYQDVTDADLVRYIDFAASDAGVRYHKVTLDGFKKAISEGSYRWGQAIADIMVQAKGKVDI